MDFPDAVPESEPRQKLYWSTPVLSRFLNNRNVLGALFMLPAAVLLLLFLTYPLGLGTWLGFTDAKVGRPGVWVGLDNFQSHPLALAAYFGIREAEPRSQSQRVGEEQQ